MKKSRATKNLLKYESIFLSKIQFAERLPIMLIDKKNGIRHGVKLFLRKFYNRYRKVKGQSKALSKRKKPFLKCYRSIVILITHINSLSNYRVCDEDGITLRRMVVINWSDILKMKIKLKLVLSYVIV